MNATSRQTLVSVFTLGLTLTLTACDSGLTSSGSSCSGGVSAATGSDVAQTALTTPIRVPLTGCTLIDYSVATTVGGTSALNLIIDSGSTTLAVAGSSCSNCTSITPLYDPSTSGKNTCQTAQSLYGDGSGWNGSIFNDGVQISTVPSASVALASMTSQSNSFFTNYDCQLGNNGANSSQGIIGLAGSQIAEGGTIGYMQALNKQQSFPNLYAVEMCETGGNIWFGNYDASYASGSPVYTPITRANQFYWVTLNNISVGGSSLGLSPSSFPGGVIVDTGTSIAIFPQAVYDSIRTSLSTNSAFQTFVGSAGNATAARAWFDNGNCVSSAQSESAINSSLPSLTLTFPSTTTGQTITVTLPASRSYLDLHVVGGTHYFCQGMGPDSDNTDPAIIGGSFLRSQITILDRNSGRVGFAPENHCAL